MQNERKKYEAIFASFGMLLLILDSKTALLGATEGLSICLESVIPSLFPMIFISVFLNSRLTKLNLRIITPAAKLVGIPAGLEGILLISILGGYPVGAQTIAQAYKNKNLDKETAERLLTFCNNAGPSFIFGVTSVLFQRNLYVWLLWFIQVASAYITGLIMSGKKEAIQARQETAPVQSVSNSLQNSIKILSTICAWVIIFRVVICVCNRWLLWLCTDWVRIFFTGILELTNGCLSLTEIASESVRFLICSVLLGAGGICVLMQTVSVIAPLNPMKYIAGKLVHTSISFLLSFLALFLIQPINVAEINPLVLLIPLTLILTVIFIDKKTVAKSRRMLYTVPNR